MVFDLVYRPLKRGGRFFFLPPMLRVNGSKKYPEEDPPGWVLDQGLELLKKTRRDHRATKTVANRARIGLGLRHVGKGMQHDIPQKGLKTSLR